MGVRREGFSEWALMGVQRVSGSGGSSRQCLIRCTLLREVGWWQAGGFDVDVLFALWICGSDSCVGVDGSATRAR